VTGSSKWSSASRFPNLLKDVLLARIEAARDVTLLQYDPDKRTLERAEWPAELSSFREHAIAESVRMRAPELFKGPPSREPPVAHVPAMAGPIFETGRSGPDFGRGPGGGELLGWQIIRIDPDVLKNRVLPELTAIHFPTSNSLAYDVLITQARDGEVVFASSTDLQPSSFDAKISTPISLQGRGGPPRPQAPRGGRGERAGPAPGGAGGGPGGPGGATGWRLFDRYRGGSLEGFVGRPPDESGRELRTARRSGGSDCVYVALRGACESAR
jgi:hypothetical protein